MDFSEFCAHNKNVRGRGQTWSTGAWARRRNAGLLYLSKNNKELSDVRLCRSEKVEAKHRLHDKSYTKQGMRCSTDDMETSCAQMPKKKLPKLSVHNVADQSEGEDNYTDDDVAASEGVGIGRAV